MKLFTVDGNIFSLEEMLRENPDLADWLNSAEVGEVFPAFVHCERIA